MFVFIWKPVCLKVQAWGKRILIFRLKVDFPHVLKILFSNVNVRGHEFESQAIPTKMQYFFGTTSFGMRSAGWRQSTQSLQPSLNLLYCKIPLYIYWFQHIIVAFYWPNKLNSLFSGGGQYGTLPGAITAGLKCSRTLPLSRFIGAI